MNTYYLKRIRRRYKYYWEGRKLWVLDMKKEKAEPFVAVHLFVLRYAYDHLGIWTGSDYHKRLLKRQHKRLFKLRLRDISPTPNSSPNTTP
jgi:hypothetical protein